MGFPTKIQLIKRQKSQQWYVNFPAAVAQAMEFEKGEIVEWVVENKKKMILKRATEVTTDGKKKTQQIAYSRSLISYLINAEMPLNKQEVCLGPKI